MTINKIECGIGRSGEKVICSVHGVELEERIKLDELMSQAFHTGAWRCPISNRIIPDFDF